MYKTLEREVTEVNYLRNGAKCTLFLSTYLVNLNNSAIYHDFLGQRGLQGTHYMGIGYVKTKKNQNRFENLHFWPIVHR